MINSYRNLCVILISTLFSKIMEDRATIGDPKISPTLGGFNIDFLVFLSFFPYGQNKVAKSFVKCNKN